MAGRSPSGRATRASTEPQEGLGHSASVPNAGDVFAIIYPFVRETFEEFGCDPVPTWRPGIKHVDVGPEDSGAMADGQGYARFTVIGSFKPGRFPTRVFYTRKFIDPDGREFGKGKLHISTLAHFRGRIRGYRIPYGVGGPLFPRTSRAELRRILDEALAGLSKSERTGA